MDAAEALAPAEGPDDGLDDRERQILAFERQWWKYAGAKEQAIRELFDMSATRYYQLLNAVVDKEAALAVDPMLVKRLRRIRSGRQRARAARRLGVTGPGVTGLGATGLDPADSDVADSDVADR
ncbi:hypothetical protein GCM10010185_02420 [Saccharothrix coeruleofusca]|uniref:DUF3263 domain-containing protein n=1 Tax=Saccharothrix coeruleofusca TaxID=33919 RepID=A0A918AGZ1_9PSEU|nr:hypothetical protein GCM10010185_02420 [Saccharothrix coeruleofusca]